MTGYRAITRARKIVFWISAALFVATWPILVLYALGIVISPSAAQPVVETGVIRVESLPGGAHLVLNGKDTGKTTPAAIERLKAGDYRLELRKSGYLDWKARVSIDTQAVRRVSYAVMVPHLPKVHLISIGAYAAERLSVNSQFLVLTGRTVGELRVFDLKSEHFLAQSAALAPYAQDPIEKIATLPWGNALMLDIRSAGDAIVLVVHVGTLGVDLQHAVRAPLFRKVDFAWSPTLSGAVYFLKDGSLWRMETWSASTESLLAGSVTSIGVVNNNLYYIDAEGSFGQISTFGRRRVLFKVPLSLRDRLPHGTRIEYAEEDWGAALTSAGDLFLFRSDEIAEYHDIRGVSVDKSRNRFVLWSDKRIGSLAFPATGKAMSEEIDWKPSPPTNQKISFVTLAAGMSNCLFVSAGTVWIEPVLTGIAGSAQRVFTLSPGERYMYSEATGLLLVFDPATGRIHVMRFITRPLLPSLE